MSKYDMMKGFYEFLEEYGYFDGEYYYEEKPEDEPISYFHDKVEGWME